MGKGIRIKFKSDRRSQAAVTHLFDALLGKPPSPTCEKCGGITIEEGPLAGRCGCKEPAKEHCLMCDGWGCIQRGFRDGQPYFTDCLECDGTPTRQD